MQLFLVFLVLQDSATSFSAPKCIKIAQLRLVLQTTSFSLVLQSEGAVLSEPTSVGRTPQGTDFCWSYTTRNRLLLVGRTPQGTTSVGRTPQGSTARSRCRFFVVKEPVLSREETPLCVVGTRSLRVPFVQQDKRFP